MAITYHDTINEALDYTAFDPSGLIDKKDLDPILQNFDDALAAVNGLEPVDIDVMIGDSILTDGGTVGRYLQLFMVYIEDFRKKGTLDKQELGVLYGRAMEIAADNALKVELSGTETTTAKAKVLSDLANAIAKVNQSAVNDALTTVEIAKAIYDYERIKPVTRLSLEEDVENKHIQHALTTVQKDTALYNLSTMLPKEATILDKNAVILDKDAIILDKDGVILDKNAVILDKNAVILDKNAVILDKDADKLDREIAILDVKEDTDLYNLGTILPTEVEKLDAEIAILDVKKDTDLYNLNTILPTEVDKLLAEIALLGVRKDTDLYNLNTMLPAEVDKLEADTALVGKNEDILDLQISTIIPKEALKLDKDIDMLAKQIELLVVKKATDLYHLNTMLPAELAKLIADTDLVRKNEDILDLHITQLIPAEIAKMQQDVIIATRKAEIEAEKLLIAKEELLIKKYELSTMLPAQVNKINGEIALMNADRLIKDAYRTTVQPHEALLAEAKAHQERINAGLVGGGTPLPTARIAQLEKQTELYDRQKSAYNDDKYQKLLDTQINYNAMVFADDPTPESLDVCKEAAIDDTYTSLLSS